MKKGFTLIELLVVVSIISLLASIILTNITTARDKAQIAAGKEFSAEVLNTAGDMMVGQWNFDECSGTTAFDTSGNRNTGTLVNAPSWSTNTPSGTGCSLSFNGTSQYVTVPDSPSMDFTGDLSIGAWINPSVLGGGWRTIAAKRGGSGASYEFVLNSSTATFNYFNGTLYTSTFVPPINKWTYVTAVISGTVLTLYQNGSLLSTLTVTPVSAYPSNPFTIGAQEGIEFFGGLIDSVSVYNKSLTALEVENLYLAEESKIQNLALK